MVSVPVERDGRGKHAVQGICERRAGRVEDRGVKEPGGPGRRRMAALALPGVETDVVMIAAGRDEGGARAQPLLQLEAEYVAIEAERAVEVGDLQVHMPDPRACDNGWIWRHGSFLLMASTYVRRSRRRGTPRRETLGFRKAYLKSALTPVHPAGRIQTCSASSRPGCSNRRARSPRPRPARSAP